MELEEEITSILETMQDNAKEMKALTQKRTELEKANRELSIRLQSICPHKQLSFYRDFMAVHSGFITVTRCTVCGQEFLV